MKSFRKVSSNKFDQFLKDKNTTEKNVYREYDPDDDHDEVIYHCIDNDSGKVIAIVHSVIPCESARYIRG